ncbi:MAG: hypothetical protein F4Z35_06225 [Dehalococcoidia bacterium]|nr:hypothetical protein [Dehalococcoidia bacterium]
MSNEIFDMKRGIKARLENIPGLRVITYQPEDWSDFPVAIIRTDGTSASRSETEFVVTVMAGGSNRRESYDTLDSHIAASGEMSIEAAIDDDVTLGGAADRAYLVGVDNIRIVRMGARRYVGADFRIRVENRTKAEATPPKEERSDTLSNERDGTNRNYFDMTNIPGAHGALAQTKIDDPSGTWSGARRMWIAKRSGEGRDANLFFQAESGSMVRGSTIFEEGAAIWSGSAQASPEASGGECARMDWSKVGAYTTRSEFTLCGYARMTIAAPDIPSGRFRVLVRARTDTDNAELGTGHMGFGLGWSSGSTSKTPDESEAVFPETASEFRMLDLGELTLPPTAVPEGYAAPEFNLDIHGTLSGGGAKNDAGAHHFRWSVDCVTLLPIDEGEVVVSGVGPSERILLDTLSEAGPGVYMLDGSDTVLGPADFEGAPFRIGPEDTRVYVVRDDVSDPSGVKFGVETSLTPLTAGF